ncbi:MAG: adenylate/guanylate cyclase domain-containing protein [Rhodospirillaceae bacterium]|nr:adenylate/guanylate cyclase domain-containing protein [Rhodospirillaceae bacterium]|tara:strand:+ start:24104 stop:25870 length:1767 start_codon:yes stop_codon:yes gene_type:complete
MDKVKRKLATILATDCVNFSKFMEDNEELTLSNLKSCRDIIEKTIENSGGRVFHTAGDSVIADFASPVECVNAAAEFQNLIFERNNQNSTELKLMWRVGIHVDDVIIEGENIYGSGVNVAARLESQCEPGEILVSRIVQDQVNKRTNFVISSAGTKSLKNISENFEVFNIKINQNKKTTALKSDEVTQNSNNTNNNKKPKLAVLPFANNSNNDDSGYLADGIVEDLITEFSMIKEFDVLSRQTAFDIQKDQKIIDFAVSHKVDFLISGGIRSSGKRVRITIELSEVPKGNILWSNKYDRVLEDIFDVQDEIVRTITIALLGNLEISSLQRSKRKPTENMTSYELLLRGKEQHHKVTKEANALALEFFDKAVEADDSNAQAYAWKACTIGQALGRGYFEGDMSKYWGDAMEALKKAQDLNENDFELNRLLSAVHLSNHSYDLAEEHGRKAHSINPNDPRILSGYGEVLVRNGSTKEGLDLLNKALELDPIPLGQSNSDNRYKDLLLGYFFDKDFEKCDEIGKKIDSHDSKSWLLLMYAKQEINSLEKNELFNTEYKKFSPDDWKTAIDRFHIPDDKIRNEIEKFAESLS